MRILTAGGGSGGHVTPIVAVLRELHKTHPDAEIRFWCDKHFEEQARALISGYDKNLEVETIISGKLRRYSSIPLWRQMLRLRTIVWPNLRDSFKVVAGVGQSIVKLVRWRPDVIFTKGGYVCLPIGIAAKILGIPLVIHDSDAHPGLTNRILARWARLILTGAPLSFYSYPKSRSRYVGIPISVDLAQPELTPSERRANLGLEADKPLVVSTGGGLGAARINSLVVDNLEALLDQATVIIVTGKANYDETAELAKDYRDHENLKIYPFISGNLHEYFAAADVVVTRAGMTTLLELAALARPTIIVPNAYLTGSHQVKNAAVYQSVDGAIVLVEKDLEARPQLLHDTISELLRNEPRRTQLSESIRELAKPDAAMHTAEAIIEVISDQGSARS